MLALFVKGSVASTKDPQSLRGSRSAASAHLLWSRDINKLNGKYVKIN